jgi:hypothetical protein
MKVIVNSENHKNIIILNGSRESFRCRQRSKKSDGSKIESLGFISYKAMINETKRGNKKIIGPLTFYSRARM